MIIHLLDGEGHHVESERPPNQEDIGKIFETKLGGHKIDNPLNDHMPHKDQETAGSGKFFEEFRLFSFYILILIRQFLPRSFLSIYIYSPFADQDQDQNYVGHLEDWGDPKDEEVIDHHTTTS